MPPFNGRQEKIMLQKIKRLFSPCLAAVWIATGVGVFASGPAASPSISGRDSSGKPQAADSVAKEPDFCMFLANHWSYTGIGWSSGLKSCAQSIEDSLAMADYSPSVKTGINLDALAYAMVAEKYPEVAERLRRYLKEGKVEIIGATYGQPMGSMTSGESNIRQMVAGQQTIQKSLGVLASSFLEEEEFTHPQLPQLLKGAGFRFASAAQCNTWGKHGSPPLDLNVFHWQGLDGTTILATPINGLVFHPPVVTHDMDWLWSDEGRHRVAELRRLGMPLAIKWVEFGWGPNELEGKTANKFFASRFRELSEKFNVKYTTLSEYIEKYGNQAKERISWRMDDFHKLQPWGVGGDQLRREGRETEALLLAAERFEAVARMIGLDRNREPEMEDAWNHLLIAQSHDASLCEYWPGLDDPWVKEFVSATGTVEENKNVNTWGTLGSRHMQVARKTAGQILDTALGGVSAAVDTAKTKKGEIAIIVFNSCSESRDAIVATGKCQFKNSVSGEIVVYDAEGRQVPSQLLAVEKNQSGDIVAADVAFQARQLPSIGYATYYMGRAKPERPQATGLKIADTGFGLENEFLSLELDSTNGAITRLIDKRQGQDLIDGKRCPFPVFNGRPNKEHPAAQGVPDEYSSLTSKAEISWVERGPVRAVIKTVHHWPKVRMEQLITLQAGQPFVESRIQLQADVPPPPGEGKINGWQFPLEIEEGYWLSFAPAFKPVSVIRDFPFGVEATSKEAIDSLTFMDLVGPQGGILVVHGGTQYFKRNSDGVFSNLAIREWNSHFLPKQYGWPALADYRFRLFPHSGAFTNVDRLKAVEAFDQQPICRLEPLHAGKLPGQRSFISSGGGGLITSFRSVGPKGYELRVIEQNGQSADARVKLDLPVEKVALCDFLGRASGGSRAVEKGIVKEALNPWQVKTLQLEVADSQAGKTGK
jgi:alpha-mannosidase